MIVADTAPDIRARQLGVYRAMGPERRVEIALAMSEEAYRLTQHGVRARDPSLDAHGVRREMLRILHGSPLGETISVASPKR